MIIFVPICASLREREALLFGVPWPFLPCKHCLTYCGEERHLLYLHSNWQGDPVHLELDFSISKDEGEAFVAHLGQPSSRSFDGVRNLSAAHRAIVSFCQR